MAIPVKKALEAAAKKLYPKKIPKDLARRATEIGKRYPTRKELLDQAKKLGIKNAAKTHGKKGGRDELIKLVAKQERATRPSVWKQPVTARQAGTAALDVATLAPRAVTALGGVQVPATAGRARKFVRGGAMVHGGIQAAKGSYLAFGKGEKADAARRAALKQHGADAAGDKDVSTSSEKEMLLDLASPANIARAAYAGFLDPADSAYASIQAAKLMQEQERDFEDDLERMGRAVLSPAQTRAQQHPEDKADYLKGLARFKADQLKKGLGEVAPPPVKPHMHPKDRARFQQWQERQRTKRSPALVGPPVPSDLIPAPEDFDAAGGSDFDPSVRPEYAPLTGKALAEEMRASFEELQDDPAALRDSMADFRQRAIDAGIADADKFNHVGRKMYDDFKKQKAAEHIAYLRSREGSEWVDTPGLDKLAALQKAPFGRGTALEGSVGGLKDPSRQLESKGGRLRRLARELEGGGYRKEAGAIRAGAPRRPLMSQRDRLELEETKRRNQAKLEAMDRPIIREGEKNIKANTVS